MKATYKFILAAFAAAVALSSCTKDIAADRQDTESQDGLRKIAISFDTPTKTYLGEDGLTPKFEDGDEILISDGKVGTEPKIVKVQKKGEEAFFETNLKGNLKAVYPAEAAVFNQKTGDLSVKISSKQFGLFKDANIAIGTLNGDTMTFRNETAVLKFYVGPEIDVTMLKIHAVDTVSFDWQLSSEGNTIWVECSGIPDSVRVCYVAVNPMNNPVMLEVQSFTTTQTKSPDDPVTRIFSSVSLERSDMVNVFIPYYIDVNGQKWAYCNVGAFLPEEPGLYFAWGETTGYRFDFPNNVYVPQHSFCWENYSFIASYDENFNPPTMTFKEYVSDSKYAVDGNPDKKTTLDLKDDAAFQSWGGNWRMPTCSEFDKLAATDLKCSGTLGKYILFDDYGLILSFTGYGYDNTVTNYTTDACYWSSSILKGCDNQASILHGIISDSIIKISTEGHERRRGFPIRPIYDETTGGNDAVGLKLSAYTDGKTL